MAFGNFSLRNPVIITTFKYFSARKHNGRTFAIFLKYLHLEAKLILNFFKFFRHRQANVLPSFEDAAEDLDNLNDLLQYIGHTSPECLVEPGRPLNAIISAGHFLDPVMEKEMIAGM